MSVLQPESLEELIEAVKSTPCLLPVGAGTKRRLAEAVPGIPRLCVRGLSGLVEYEPDEYTFTARAGTPLREIAAALAERGQYLPFDPLLLDAGSTLGGAVASGLSGPGRFRYGGLRDFILGVRFVDGAGRLLRMGGKVVKNAAGFDLPKFFVGSLGRFGVLAELTFKVFPRPARTRTLRLASAGNDPTLRLLTHLARGRWELDALDVPPTGGVLVRLAGPDAALPVLATEILSHWPGETLTDIEADRIWTDLREFRWTHPAGWLGKLVLSPVQYPEFAKTVEPLPEARIHLSAGGNVAYVSLPTASPPAEVDLAWKRLGLQCLSLRGASALWLGQSSSPEIHVAVKQALDPEHRFPNLAD